jgi:hypothetical protein
MLVVVALCWPWRRHGSGGCLPTPLCGMSSSWVSWPPSWRPFLRGDVVMSLYGEDRCPTRASRSLGRGSIVQTSRGWVGGIGYGESGRAGSRSWCPRHSGCARTPVHQAGWDVGGAEPRGVMSLSPGVVLSSSGVLPKVTLCPRTERSEGMPSFLYLV